MTEEVPVEKVANKEMVIPSKWRDTLSEIVKSFVNGDYHLDRVPFVSRLRPSLADLVKENISAYGDELVLLPEASWETSVYLWMNGYWQVVVDLFVLNKGRSDLGLFVKVREDGDQYTFEVTSVHVE